MAYLVRRLLENTANESFLRASFTEHVPEEVLLMIAAQELLARGMSLQAGDTIHYIITDADAAYPPDRARAVAGLVGTWCYDVSAYDSLLLKATLVLLTPLGMTATSLNESTAGC